ncbi:MAG: FtsX-like permease family protein, partial [Chloroflexota bacterium]|nr:FtsX-like permease family protein [Chloroflexota bacterium]
HATRAESFEELFDEDGNPVDLAGLAGNAAYITRDGADELEVPVGGTLNVFFGPGALTPITIGGIVEDSYFSGTGTDVVLMMPLGVVQGLLDRPGELSSLLISNTGDAIEGVELSLDVVDRYESHPEVEGQGLEIIPIKQDVLDTANEVGSLFVSFFTTFGLFSIGVGLLLIFLIFSMLAAERKTEMGMSRAIGMQRHHLVRMFTVEGSIYGVGSALVGAAIGIGLGMLLVEGVASIFEQGAPGDFSLTPHAQPVSFIVSFLVGSVLTFVTVYMSSRRISRLNIVQAIRDLPEAAVTRSRIRALIQAVAVAVIGLLLLTAGWNGNHLTSFGLGVSFTILGAGMVARSLGASQRWTFTVVGALLVAYWLIPHGTMNAIRGGEWNEDFSSFFASGVMLVTGAVLVTINNSPLVLGLMTNTFGRIRRFSPVVKSAVSYPLRFGYRTGLSLAMFAIVIFSVTLMATLLDAFDNLFENQERLGGGYEVIGYARSDLNPVADVGAVVEANPDLDIVERFDGRPSVGTFHAVFQADARLTSDTDGDYADTVIVGADDAFLATNRFTIALTTPEYTVDGEADAGAVWEALRANPGLAVVNSNLVPTHNTFAFQQEFERFTLDGVPDFYVEDEVMEPVEVTVRDLEVGESVDLTVIAVLDTFASSGPVPVGFYTSEETLGREVDATQFFFNVHDDAENGANVIESAFFQHGIETIDVIETIEDVQDSQRALFNLLIGFMSLGLVVGIAALGVISARAVVERRHEIGVLRAIGFSRGMVNLSFLAESSFIALLGIGVGLGLGLVASVNLIFELREDEPNLRFSLPMAKILLIAAGAYVFSLLTTFLPARQAAEVNPPAAPPHQKTPPPPH